MLDSPGKFFGAIALAFVLFFGGLVALVKWSEESQCANVAAVMNSPYVYGINTPCMIQRNGQWEPLYRTKRD